VFYEATQALSGQCCQKQTKHLELHFHPIKEPKQLAANFSKALLHTFSEAAISAFRTN
jgi:hypothetical protein